MNFKKQQKDQLIFSSEDSLNSNNSFASSVEENDQEDFNNNFMNLKDQMDHFFSQNPQLQDAIKFEPLKEPNSDQEDDNQQNQGSDQQQNHHKPAGFDPYGSLKKSPNKGKQSSLIEHRNLEEVDRKKKLELDSDNNSESESPKKNREVKFNLENQKKEKSKLWTSMTKDIIRMGQFGCKTPTLETVNHRLNIFKSKIEKIDYLEYLQKEMTQTAGGLLSQQQGGQNANGQNLQQTANQNAVTSSQINNNDQADEEGNLANKQFEQEEDDENVGRDSEGNIIYFSFKKRMQMELRQKVERSRKIKEEENRLKSSEIKQRSGDRRVNLTGRGVSDALKLIKQQQLIEKKKRANSEDEFRNKRKSFTGLKSEKSIENEEKKLQFADKDQNLNFQTRIGIALYQTYQQCAGDKESFKKTANFILKDYNKTKASFFKKKPFPPQTTKFTNEETKNLNVYLPDFSSNLYAPNKNNLFANIDTFELPPGTPEGDFIQIVDKILDGAVLRFWKESQNQQD
ncbi:hypothetical protein ABPG74_009465 [Tetrahymena malaccensis]